MQGTELDLINALERERRRRQLNHRAFSTLLGIHESYWHRIRTGERSLNLNTLQIFMQKLPEVTPEVTIYIMRQGNDAGGDGGRQAPPDSLETPEKLGGKSPGGYIDVCPPPKHPQKT